MPINRPVKALFCTYDWQENNSGPATWLAQLLPRLNEYGITPAVLLHYWDAPGPLYQALLAAKIPVSLAPCTGFTEDRVAWILRNTAEYNPDVFVPNLVTPALLGSRYIKRWGIPTIGVLHSDDRFYHAVSERFVYGRKADALSAIVCVSKHIETEVLKRQIATTIIKRIPYGIDVPEKFLPKPPSPFRIAYVGRLAEEQKRISDVVRAMCLVTNQIPETEAVLFGEGPDRSVAENLAKSLATNGKVKLAGRVDNTEIQSKLQQYHAILLLSDYEGLPIALLEGMANGAIPIVTRMKSGIPELIEHNINGLIVDDRTDGVVSAVQHLVRNLENRARLATEAQNTIRKHYTLRQNADHWARLILEMCGKQNGSKRIYMPQKLELAAVHPDLSQEDPRKPSRSRYAQVRIFLGRLRSKLFKRSLKV